ncbi:response regulator [Caballeronia sp. LZ062]|uniref:response regulator n=1 Tax=unclassified Caballeronia TaxID=2646786 RepID=UPI0028658EE9|nr:MULTISPECIES: response regulator [unclassified Caballeronia]MDR5854949.1 response regulator [Caballeronia sp. LZ050]MDR5870522.1 response regulator [Caballeronia sp. LZ062]
MNKRAHETSTAQCALWNRRQLRLAREARRVLVASTERALGESLVKLFDLKGFPARFVADVSSLRQSVGEWHPQVLFIDTRIGGCANYALVRELRTRDDDAHRLVIAMSGFLPEEPLAALKEAGYDGHCRRPCPVWQMTDILDEFFACHLVR